MLYLTDKIILDLMGAPPPDSKAGRDAYREELRKRIEATYGSDALSCVDLIPTVGGGAIKESLFYSGVRNGS